MRHLQARSGGKRGNARRARLARPGLPVKMVRMRPGAASDANGVGSDRATTRIFPGATAGLSEPPLAAGSRPVKRWFSDDAFRSIVRNASYLGSGKVASALLGLLALALAGRGMTTAAFGSLVVVLAYARGVSGLAQFQTWQFIVRFGTPALERGDARRFRDVTGFSFGLDIASGAAALVGGIALLPLVAGVVGISPQDLPLALLYCTLIPFMNAATPTGLLRTFDRFDLLAAQELVTPLVRVAGAIASYAAGLGFPGFIATWYAANLLDALSTWAFAIHELRRRRIAGALRPGLRAPARRIPGSWGFVWATNFSYSISSAWGPGSNLVVGMVLGPVAAGLFKIAFTFFNAIGKPANLLGQSFYPEIMRLDPSSKRPWKLGLRSGALAAGVGIIAALVLVVAGKPVIGLVFGHRYAEAYPLLQIMAAALVVSMASFPLQSLLYMAGRHRAALVGQALAAALFLALLVALARGMGLVGTAVAYVAGQCLMALFWLVPTWSAWRHRGALTYETPPRDHR